jgi:hypothetical protein
MLARNVYGCSPSKVFMVCGLNRQAPMEMIGADERVPIVSKSTISSM